jgi:hypothetical protein
VAHGGEPTARARAVLRAWATQNLLHAHLVIEARDWAAGATTVATLVTGEASSEVELDEAVAAGDYAVIRLVALTVVGHAPVDPDELTRAGDRAERLLQSYLALEHQTLVRINLLVPSTDGAFVPRDMLRQLWDVNVVVSPEDRARDDHAAARVNEERRLPEHAALAVATAGALWAGMAEGPFDTRRQGSGSDSPSVVVSRSFARVVLGSGLVPHVLARVFALRSSSPGLVAQAAHGVPAMDQERVVRASTEALLNEAGRGQFNFVAYVPGSPPAPLTLSLREALKRFFRYMFRRAIDAPREFNDKVRTRVRGRLGDFVQRATFGPESIVATTFGGLPRAGDGSRSAPVDAVAAAQATAVHILASMQAASVPSATPALWRELRQVSFGLLDGGELPPYVTEPLAGDRREIVTDVTLIAARPSAAPFRPDLPEAFRDHKLVQAGVRECDPAQAAMLHDWLTDERASLEGQEGREEDAAALDTALQQLAEWLLRRESTLVWAVPARCLAGLAAAGRSLNANLELVAHGPAPIDTAAQDRADRRLRRWWTFFGVAGLLLVVWGGGSRLLGSPRSPGAVHFGYHRAWWLITGGLLGSLLGWCVVFAVHQRRLLRLAARFARELYLYECAVLAAEHDAQQVVRLASVYTQARDWAEILAWMVHRPEGAVRAEDASEPTKIPEGSFAAGFAEGRSTAESETRAGAMMANSVFVPGWLTALYARYQKAILGRYQHARGLDHDAFPADPDSDVADPSRQPILTGLQDGTESEAWLAELRRGVEERLARTSPDELFPEVRAPGADPADGPTSAAAFLSQLLPDEPRTDLLIDAWSAAGKQGRANRVAESNVWAPVSLALPATVRARQTRPVRSQADAYCIQAVRMDVANPAPYEWFSVFGQEAPGEQPVATVQMDAPPPDMIEIY